MTSLGAAGPLALVLALFAVPALAELPTAEPHGFQSMADRAEVRLGQPFEYTIQVRHDPADRYQLEGQAKPSAGGTTTGGPDAFLQLDPFEAADVRCETVPAPGKEREESVTTCRMRLALFDLGEHDVPDIRLLAQGPAGDRLLVVPGPRVKGLGLIDPKVRTEELALRNLAPPVPLMVPSWRLVWWALGVLAFAALAWAGWKGWNRWRRRPRAVTDALPLPPHARFERRLSDLAVEQLPQRGRQREYFFRLSEIVREYLGALFSMNALDLTTAELLEALSRRASSTIDNSALKRWCERADLVKYARYQPTEAECAEALQYAQGLAEQTRPAPEPVRTEAK